MAALRDAATSHSATPPLRSTIWIWWWAAGAFYSRVCILDWVLIKLELTHANTDLALLPPLLSPSAGGCDCAVPVRQPDWLIQVGINAGPGVHAMDPGFCGGAHSLLVGSHPCMCRPSRQYSHGFLESSRPRPRFPAPTNTALHGMTKHVRLVRIIDSTMPSVRTRVLRSLYRTCYHGFVRVRAQPRDGGVGSRVGAYRLLAVAGVHLPSPASRIVP